MNSNKKFVILLEIFVITFLVMSVVTVCGLSDSSADISAYPSIVNPGDEIRVTYSGAPGYFWDHIVMYKVGDQDEGEYGEWQVLKGEKSGTLFFTAPDEPGDYEFRLFESFELPYIARSNIVTVQAGTLPTSEEAVVLFEANFDDGYAPGFGNEVGDWEVHLFTGKYTATTDTYRFSMAGDTNWQDYVIEADFFNAQDGGLLVRAQDQDNCIALIVRPSYNVIYWYVRKGGMWADYKGQVTLGHEPGEELQVKVEVVGSEFKAYVNDVLKTTVENTEFPKGKIGLYLYYQPDQYWDNVVVYSSGATGPAPTPTTPTEGGLVGYWDFNEGSGNIAYDSSGSGNDGTIHGATWVDNGSCKKALSFDGVDDYVETNPATFQSNDITVEAWIYPKSFSSYKTILHKGDRIGANNFLFTFDLISNKISFFISSNGNTFNSIVGATNLELNKWYHVVGVYRSRDKFFAVYVNGTEDNSKTATLSSLYHDASKYWIGARYDNRQFVSGRYFNGIIDEVRIYDRALNQSEIQADMNECAPMPTSIDHAEAPVTVLTSSTILPTVGGLLTVESEDNELNGVSLDIPAQAVTNNVTISITTTETLPSGSPFGQVPVGKLFVLLPSNLTFSVPVTLTLPIPAGEERYNLYIGRWDDKNKIWENIGGTIDGDFIATNISHLSFYGLFYTGKSTVEIVNRQQLDTSDLPITVMYVAGPVPPPDTPDQSQFRATRPLPAGGVQLKQDESRIMQLLPGRYHFLVSYPRPQPGVANSMWFSIPVLTEGADDGQIDQTIAIRDYGADSTNPYTNDSIMFPGRTVVESTNFRPVVNCNAIVPGGVPLLETNQILNIDPIKIEQLQDEGITLSATVTDPEGSALKYYWTVPTGVSIGCFTSGTTASGSTLTAQFKTSRAGIYTVYLTVYDQYGLFNEGRWIIRVIPNAKPYIDVVVDDVVIDFGRLDSMRRFSGVGPEPGSPKNHSIPFPNVNFPGIPPIPNWGVYREPPVPGEISASTELKRIPIMEGDDPHPNITAHFNPLQYPGGMTCVYAIVADADGDAIDAEFVLPTPLFGRGNMYTAIPIPNRTNPITSEIKLSDGKTLAESFPDGYPIGAILDNYKVMDAYNAVLTEYANRGWLPLQPHVQTGHFVAPTGPRRYTVPDIELNITIVFTTPPLGEFPYVIGFNQSGIQNGSIYPEDIVTEAPNPLGLVPGLVPQGTVFKVIVVEGSWGQGTAKGYLWMIPVTDDFWDPRHAHPHQVPTLFVNGVQKATCSYVGQTLPVIWEAPCDPNIEQTTHDRRHVFDPGTIVSGGGTVQIEARVNDSFSPQERAFGLVAFPTPTSMEESMEEEDTSDGEFNCPIPIPNEASHIVEDYMEYWSTPSGFVGTRYVGPRYSWYDREKTKKRHFQCYNIDGKLHGVSKFWYEDGTPKCESNNKDGKRHGVYKFWYEDGTPKYENNYKDGKEHGVYKEWYEDGTPRYEKNYKDGKLHGVYKEWYEDGTPRYEDNYKDGKEHGVCKMWTVYGELLYECNYEEGKCVSCVHGHC